VFKQHVSSGAAAKREAGLALQRPLINKRAILQHLKPKLSTATKD
jgi:hypothetical protein